MAGDDLVVAIEAMRHDAQMWNEAAAATASACQAAYGLTLTDFEMSWAGRETGLLDTYQQIQHKAAMLLGEGTQTFTKLSDTLYKLANDFEVDDKGAAARLRGVWSVWQR